MTGRGCTKCSPLLALFPNLHEKSSMYYRCRLPIWTAIAALLLVHASSQHASPQPALQAPPYSCPFCTLQAADLAGKNFVRANLRGASFAAGVNMSGFDFSEAMLAGAHLPGAILRNATLNNADLSKADLTGAVLTGAKMNGTDLQYAVLTGAVVSETELSLATRGPALDRSSQQSGNKDAHWEMTCGTADLSQLHSAVYVSTSGSDSNTCGNKMDTACKTIAQGVHNCSGSACGVLVAFGAYPQPSTLALRDGVSLYGGCLKAGTNSPQWKSLISAPANGVPAVAASGIASPTILQNFKIDASPATQPGSASIAMEVSKSPGLLITGTQIYANQGAGGKPGATPGVATRGGDAKLDAGGQNSTCPGSDGGQGSGVMNTHTVNKPSGGPVEHGGMPVIISTTEIVCDRNNCDGMSGQAGSTGLAAPGGPHGDPNLGSCAYYRGGNGHEGSPGHVANCGNKGDRSTDRQGTLSNGVWTPAWAGSGSAGGNGGGGGGGGAGGATGGFCVVVDRNYMTIPRGPCSRRRGPALIGVPRARIPRSGRPRRPRESGR